MKICKYAFDATSLAHSPQCVICFFYLKTLTRYDGKDWCHFPKCSKDTCPKTHPELWQMEARLTNNV